MEDVTRGISPVFYEMGRSHNKIVWQRFMEGMLSKEIISIQADYVKIGAYTVILEL